MKVLSPPIPFSVRYCAKPPDVPAGFLIALFPMCFLISGPCESHQCYSTHPSHRPGQKHPASFRSTWHPLLHPSWLVSATFPILPNLFMTSQEKIAWESGTLVKSSSCGQWDVWNCSSACWCLIATWKLISCSYLLCLIRLNPELLSGLVSGPTQQGKGEL